MSRILIAGLGNIFFGDDGFGVAVARRLSTRQLPAGVKVMELGIRGFDLAYALLDPYDVIILVDAAQRGMAPGTIQVLEPALDDVDNIELPQTHGMIPSRALQMARAMGAQFKVLRIVCCEPASLEPMADGSLQLTPLVAAGVDEALAVIQTLIQQTLPEPCTNLE